MGAKSSSLATFVSRARRTGRLTLRAHATATSVTTDRSGRARGVIWFDERGRSHEERARVVVVACSAIESARLLLGRPSANHPLGLANSSGPLGKNLLFAAFASGWGRFPAPSSHFPEAARRLPFLDRSVQDLYVATGAGLPHPKAGTLLFQLPHVNPIFQLERLAWNPDGPPAFGAELKRRMREFFHETHTVEWEAFSEILPHPGCEVTLDPDVKDRSGRPAARIRISMHAASLAASDFLAARAREVLGAAGSHKQGTSSADRSYTVLQAGTARMGKDPARSVLDPTGQAHDVRRDRDAESSGSAAGRQPCPGSKVD